MIQYYQNTAFVDVAFYTTQHAIDTQRIIIV